MEFFVDFSNKPQKIGSFLTIKSELQLVTRLMNDQKISVYCVRGPNDQLNSIFYLIISDDTNQIDISYIDSDQINFKNNYPENILHELNDDTYYSTARLRFLHKVFKVNPELNWGKKTMNKVDAFTSRLENNFFVVHIAEPFILQNKEEYFLSWLNFLARLRENTAVPFIFVGNIDLPQDIKKLSGVHFLDNLGFSIAEQCYLISRCSFFIGVASGMCTPAMLSTVPYIIFKHPDYHQVEMNMELFNSRLPWATKDQIFQLVPISEDVLDSFRKEIMKYATK